MVKVGSSSLTAAAGGIDLERLTELSEVLAARRLAGAQVILVSSGAIASGMTPLGLRTRPKDLATQQAAASVGQGGLVAAYTHAFGRHGLTVGQILLTAEDVTRRGHYVNARRTLERLLDLGVVPVVNENDTVATQEIRFGDNDRLAALVAHLADADALVLLSDVDAVYDGPPTRRGASRIAEVTCVEDLAEAQIGRSSSGLGTGGMMTKVEAASIATADGIPTVLTSTVLAARALAGEDVGTYFHPTGTRRQARLRWLAHASAARGRIFLDDGAVEAVVTRRTSLLPVGITAVDGTFSSGDPVDLCGADGRVVARGLVGYDSGDLVGLVGRPTDRATGARRLRDSRPGRPHVRTVVRRDDLVVL